ncbi:MAG: hypothetical protein PVS3B1_04520 [Ktedonobacteraceae bacterium]
MVQRAHYDEERVAQWTQQIPNWPGEQSSQRCLYYQHAPFRGSLQRLDLSGLHLVSLPPNIGQFFRLQELDLRNNQLTSLPTELSYLPHLHTLELAGNPGLRTPPPEVVAQGARAAVVYCHAQVRFSLLDALIGLGSLANRLVSHTVFCQQLINIMDKLGDSVFAEPAAKDLAQAKHIFQGAERSATSLHELAPQFLHSVEQAARDFDWRASLEIDLLHTNNLIVADCLFRKSFCHAIIATLSARLGEQDVLVKYAGDFGRSFQDALAWGYFDWIKGAELSEEDILKHLQGFFLGLSRVQLLERMAYERASYNLEFEYGRSFVLLLGAPLSFFASISKRGS